MGTMQSCLTVAWRASSISSPPPPATWWLILVLYIRSAVTTETYDPIIRTESGRVRGQRHTLETRQVVETYLGIPYAKPPLGYLRFRHPQPVERWTEVRNATTLPNSCYQSPDTQFGDFYGATVWNSPTPVSEDCLYLNVYVPRTRARRKQNLSVMVWIYGGGFYSGTPTLGVYDGKILAALGNVVVVSIGYRVGALGFLALNHPTAPGNAGLFDQLMGLEWVQRNIRSFGGNPDDVTLFGESAGSVSVSLHLLSPLSAWKFDKAIMQSGTANMPWATVTMDEAKRRAEELAFEYLGCRKTDRPEETTACLRSIPPERIVETQWVTRGVLQFPFPPVVDGVFLSDRPTELLRRHSGFKKCPILLGSNANEGSTYLIYDLGEYLDLDRATMTRVQYTKSIRRLFHYFPQYPARLSDRALAAIDLQYMSHSLNVGGRNSTKESLRNIHALDMAVGDSQFVCPLNDFAQIYAKEGLDVYTYYFTHRYSSNPWPGWMGVVHGDEIFFVLGEATKAKRNFTVGERNLSRKMMLYWTNFARTGNPNKRPESDEMQHLDTWPLHKADRQEYLELNLNLLNEGNADTKLTGRGPRSNECLFWTDSLRKLINTTGQSRETKKQQPKTMPSLSSGSSSTNVWQISMSQLVTLIGGQWLTWLNLIKIVINL